jgi:hypothetical protein
MLCFFRSFRGGNGNFCGASFVKKDFYSQGVVLNWRQEVEECGIHCHPGMEFRYIYSNFSV